jgi:hypothetical protein
MDRVYLSRDHGWLLIHGGLAQRERERERRSSRFPPMGPLGGGADGHMMVFNRSGWWCSDGEMVLGVRRRD